MAPIAANGSAREAPARLDGCAVAARTTTQVTIAATASAAGDPDSANAPSATDSMTAAAAATGAAASARSAPVAPAAPARRQPAANSATPAATKRRCSGNPDRPKILGK